MGLRQAGHKVTGELQRSRRAVRGPLLRKRGKIEHESDFRKKTGHDSDLY